MNTPDTEARERMEYFREFGKEKDNTPDTEVTTGDPQTSHASAIIKYPTPDTENANYMQVIECKCECHKSNLQLCSMCCHHHGYIWHEEHKRAISSRDTYWKERVRKEVDELWHDLGKYQGWLGGVIGNETDFTLMQQQPTKEVREAKALHTAIIMKAKEKVHQTQMKVRSLLDNLK